MYCDDLSAMVPQLRSSALQWIVLAIAVLVLCGAVLTMWLYKSIIKPIGLLKAATENIKEGNLNFNVRSGNQ